MKTICGINCEECNMKEACKGCQETGGAPFGKSCIIALCCNSKKISNCSECSSDICKYRLKLIEEINNLKIEDMSKVTELYQLKGSFVNMEYILPSGQKVKIWDDNKIYLGTQVKKSNSNKCYGIAADDNYILVCEYEENGNNPKIILLKKR